MSEQIAFRMNLNAGQAVVYQERHSEIFPELSQSRSDAWVSNYSIWFDPESNHFVGILNRNNSHAAEALPDQPFVKRCWKFMADIMETHADNLPVQVPLKRVFLLP